MESLKTFIGILFHRRFKQEEVSFRLLKYTPKCFFQLSYNRKFDEWEMLIGLGFHSFALDFV